MDPTEATFTNFLRSSWPFDEHGLSLFTLYLDNTYSNSGWDEALESYNQYPEGPQPDPSPCYHPNELPVTDCAIAIPPTSKRRGRRITTTATQIQRIKELRLPPNNWTHQQISD